MNGREPLADADGDGAVGSPMTGARFAATRWSGRE